MTSKTMNDICGNWLIFQKRIGHNPLSDACPLQEQNCFIMLLSLWVITSPAPTNSLEMKRATLIIIILHSYHHPWFMRFLFYPQIHHTNPWPLYEQIWLLSHVFFSIQSARAHHLEKSLSWWRKLSKILLTYVALSPAYEVASLALRSLSSPLQCSSLTQMLPNFHSHPVVCIILNITA